MGRLILFFQSNFQLSSHRNYNTCNKDNFRLLKVRPNWGKHAIKEFNDVEPSIREVKSSHIFKTNLRTLI